MLKIYVGHVASWVLFGIINTLIVGLKNNRKAKMSIIPVILISMFFGLITFLIHWAFFL